ncbi:MAG: hypothetical protein OZX49_01025 [Immundisolibacter sp.]|nr:hypothetical protein [Immundisolibacter sp.]
MVVLEAAVADGDQRLIHQRLALAGGAQVLDQLREAAERRGSAPGQAAALQQAREHIPHRQAAGARLGAQGVEGLVADAARRLVDDALEGGVVGRVGDQAQVRQCIANLGPVEEALAAVHAVLDAPHHERFLEGTRLGIGAVQDGRFGARVAGGGPGLDLLDHEAGLVLLVVGGVQADRFAAAGVGPQVLAQALAVVGDQGIGGGQDGAGGAVVLFQADDLDVRELALELAHVLHLGAAPAVDGLVVVADREQAGVRPGEVAQPGVLQGVGVLELVDQDVPEAPPVVVAQHRLLHPQFVRAQQQFAKVHHAAALAGGLVAAVQLGQHGAVGKALRVHVAGALALVLAGVDEGGDLGRLERLVAQFLEQALDQPLLVVGVQDLEGFRQAGLAPVGAQQAVGDAVKRAHPHAPRRHRYQLADALAHLGRGLVGEGDGQNLQRRGTLDLDQPGDAVRQHAGLAAAGAGQHQGGLAGVGDGLALRRVQAVDLAFETHAHSTIFRMSPGFGSPCG